MLRFQNLVIRKAQITDVPQLVSWWNDGKVMAHAGFPNGLGTTSEKVISLLQKDTEDRCHFIIEIDNASVGEMHYKKIKDFYVEIGIKICEQDFQNKGFGKKILSLFIQELFHNKCYKIIQINVSNANNIAKHVYTQLGFKEKFKAADLSYVQYELALADFVSYLR
ncbi:MAG: GNAT family N-acetyltransferase [Alphaproteobacteria bacterium]|nr:GNAT family N-acetyltransferase [Alphaproteobacteria bacterium]MBR2922893.1 GNAT family N-acetyltransferase [Alphaproteobacteria bacterium]